MSTFRIGPYLPSEHIIKLKHRSASKLASRINQVPDVRVIVSFYSSYPAEAPGRFSPMPSYWGIDQVIVAGHVPAATIGINAIAFIAIRVTEGVVFDKQELLASKVSCICPGSIAMGVPPPSVMINLKSQCPPPFVKNTMIDNSVNLATCHDKGIRVQLVKMAVIDPSGRTRSHKVHAAVISEHRERSISECKACQPK